MGHKIMHMEPTDESDGFVNITPDPSAHAMNGQAVEEPNGSFTSPRRPTTRSQTSTSMLHETRDGLNGDTTNEQPSSSKRTLDDMEVGQSGESLISEAAPVDFDVSAASYSPRPPNQYTFLETYTSASQSERRGPRTRTAPPVPVPNLTKKSRGRRVPTKTADKEPIRIEAPPVEGIQKTGRVYVCKVEDCGKCFSRGEHLKRHIRSIHTHEKPFKCSHPSCDKFFNRHDNLLQHQKVHKDYSSPQNSNDSYGPLQRIQQGPHFNASNNTLNSAPSANIIIPQQYAIFPSYQHSPLSGSMGFGTNMAVSSLRTELSPSHVDSPSLPPIHDAPPQPHYHRVVYDPPPLSMNQPIPPQPHSHSPNGQDIGDVSAVDFLFR